MNEKFTFFRSYAEYFWSLDDAEAKLSFINTILDYALNGMEPGREDPAYAVFQLIRPNIDKSLARSRAGSVCGANKARPGNRNAAKDNGDDVCCDFVANENATETQHNRKDKDKDKDKEEGVCISRTRGPQFTPSEILMFAKRSKVPEDYLKKFIEEMGKRDWTYMSHGNVVKVNKMNFQAALMSFYQQDQRRKPDGRTQPEGVVLDDPQYDIRSRFGV